MAAHVGLKNLLIAVLLLYFMDDIGLTGWLHELPEMNWLN